MANGRINEIHEDAVKLFLQQGYSRTQISHIAKAIGVSVGTIYHDFTGNEEIMHFILKCTIEPDFLNREFDRPIADDLFVGLEEEIISAFEISAEHLPKTWKLSAIIIVFGISYPMLLIHYQGMR